MLTFTSRLGFEENLILRPGIVGYDSDWQFPAITERHAFLKAYELLPASNSVVYLGFPWATLIDKIKNKGPGVDRLSSALRAAARACKQYSRVLTVCQHIRMDEFVHLFEDCGVTDLFWSHTKNDEPAIVGSSNIRIYPFPLFGVQAVATSKPKADDPKSVLYSFVGAKASRWYMTEARNWIIDELSPDKRGVIIARDEWFYNKVVYDHQVRENVLAVDGLTDETAAREYKDVMSRSLFSLCPSGSGPNSIRLWEALAAGSIPVIMSDRHALPGDQSLWNAAIVRCAETVDEVRRLPDRLTKLADNPAEILRMQSACRQIEHLYGSSIFIYDIVKAAFSIGESETNVFGRTSSSVNIGESLAKVGSTAENSSMAREAFLDCLIDVVKDDASEIATFFRRSADLRDSYKIVVKADPKNQSTKLKHINEALADASIWPPTRRFGYEQKPKVAFFGRHSNRTPLSYRPYRRVFNDHVQFVDDMDEADILVTGFQIDIREHESSLAKLCSLRKHIKVAVISEEPLWDTLWSPGYRERQHRYVGSHGIITYKNINHFCSKVFSFEEIPYFLTTSDDFVARYWSLFNLHSRMSSAKILDIWTEAPLQAVFVAERRDNEKYDCCDRQGNLIGLSTMRSRLAARLASSNVAVEGNGWGDAGRRQSLPDWHLEKIRTYAAKTRLMSGLENTVHRDYISEKIFDAFACLAIPIVYAPNEHRYDAFGTETSLLNIFGLSDDKAVSLIRGFQPDMSHASHYKLVLEKLAALFSSPERIWKERRRVICHILDEFLDPDWAPALSFS